MKATVFFMPDLLRREFFIINKDQAAAVAEHFKAGGFKRSGEVVCRDANDAEAAAEEMFDLTNNPSRQDERELVYGRGRSVSVGDIVRVEDSADPEKLTYWLCCSMGWAELAV